MAIAQHPGTFTTTGSLSATRVLHTATLLPNRKVLVAGGSSASALYSSTELYDPSSGTFSATGEMATARSGHTATLLPSGKVLVAGGGDGAVVTSAELYDPATGGFTPTGDMIAARRYPESALPSPHCFRMAGS